MEIPDYESYDYTKVWRKRSIEDRAEMEIVARWASGETGVELGGGFGRLTQVLERRIGRMFMLDYSLSNLRRASMRLQKTTLVRASLQRLPFDDDVFDFVAIVRVMQHIPEPSSLLREIVRVGREGGTFVLGVANEGNTWGKKDTIKTKLTSTGHRIYTTPLMRYGRHGLERAEIRGVGAFDNVLGREARRLWPLVSLDLRTSRLWPGKPMLFARYRITKDRHENEPRVRCGCGGAIVGRTCEKCGRSYGQIIDLVEA